MSYINFDKPSFLDLEKNIYISPRILDLVLKKEELSDSILNRLSEILENTEKNQYNEELFFKMIERIKNNGKKIYFKYGKTPEGKIKVLKFLIENFNKLEYLPNIRRTYNNFPKTSYSEYSNLSLKEQVSKKFYLKNSENIDKLEGGSCHNTLIIFFKNILEDILEDSIKQEFNIDIKNHGVLYLKIANKKIMIDEFNGKLALREKYDKNNKKFSYEEYIKQLDKILNNKQKIIFIYKGKKILIYKYRFLSFILFGKNGKFASKEFLMKFLKNLGTKENYLKYLGFKKDIIDKNFLKQKINDKDFFNIFYNRIKQK